jgi:two-component system LytT family sensor kinase
VVPDLLVVLVAATAVVITAYAVRRLVTSHRDLGTSADHATFATLHTASLAAPPLRTGLNRNSAERAARHVRTLLGTPAVALVDRDDVLAWDGTADEHAAATMEHAAATLASGRSEVIGRDVVACDRVSCRIAYAIAVPLVVDERVVGALVAYSAYASANLVRAANEVGRWVSAQLDLAELDASRTRAMEAEVRALRAQISPHFVYNSLTAIASFVRTDPERARDLLLEFADFTRYSFRRHGDFTTLAEELRSVERYLLLEHARFGDRLKVTLQIAPEVLPVAVPFLCLQPIVENAVRHGLADKSGAGQVTILAKDAGGEAHISIEDDGVGMDPEQLRRTLAGDPSSDSVGLGNVDERLRAVFGDDYGLVIETARGAGTKVTLRVPKFAPGVRAGG